MSSRFADKNIEDEDMEDEDVGSDEDEIDEELMLPDVLANISSNEKKELLKFKRSHNEKQWEEEVLRRSDLLGKKIDLERLKRMTKSGKMPLPEMGGKMARSSAAPSRGRRPGRRSVVREIESDEEPEAVDGDDDDNFPEIEKEADEDEDEDEFPEIAPAKPSSEEDEDEDELFDSEEEEEITKRVTATHDVGKGASKLLGGKRKAQLLEAQSPRDQAKKIRASTGRSTRNKARAGSSDEENSDFIDFEDGEERDEDGEEDMIEDLGMDIDVGKIKGRYITKKDRPAAAEAEEKKEVEKTPFEYVAATIDATGDLAELEDYQRIQTRRLYVEKWVDEPYFEKVPIYRMCEVIGVEYNQRAYKLADGKQVTTRLTVGLAGNIRKHTRVDIMSNSRITEREFTFYLESLKTRQSEGGGYQQRLLKSQVDYIRKRIVAASNHTYTNEEIQIMVKNKIGLNTAATTEYTSAMENLERKRQKAAEEKDYDVLDEIQKTMTRFKEHLRKEKEKFDLATKKSLEVNKRNRENNTKRDMMAGIRKRQEEKAALAKGLKSKAEEDPFIRRETRPSILWNTGSRLENAKEAAEAAKAADGQADKGQKEKDKETDKEKAKNGQLKRSQQDDELYMSSKLSLQDVRRRVAAKLGLDPYEEAMKSVRDRYLQRVCKYLPPANSSERLALRGRFKNIEDMMISADDS